MADILDKLAKIYTQAERAGTQEEAEAFMAKAQQLASRYSIDLEQARQHQADKEKRETPTQKRIQIGERGKPLKATWCELFMAIGRANDLKFNIAHDSTYVIAFGFPSDIRMTEAMYAFIAPQMVEMANEFIREGSWKNDKTWDDKTWSYKPVHARVARRCFYEAFIGRLGSRLNQARRAAIKEAEAERLYETKDDPEPEKFSTELVLKEKKVEVHDFYKRTSTARGSWKGSNNTYTSDSGYSAGRSAADRARLSGQRSISGGRKAID